MQSYNETCYIVLSALPMVTVTVDNNWQFPPPKQSVQLSGTCIGCAWKVNAGRNLFSCTAPCVGLFAGQPTWSLCAACRASVAADPVINSEEGTGLGQETQGDFCLLEAEDPLLTTQQIPLPVRQITKAMWEHCYDSWWEKFRTHYTSGVIRWDLLRQRGTSVQDASIMAVQ